MASTIQIQDTINWSLPFVRFAPLNIGTNNEPAISIANVVKTTILGPPFCWRWNRNTTTVTTVQGTQDYSKAVSDFGFIEKAWVTAGSSTYEIPVIAEVLGGGSEQGRPDQIAAQLDDNAGNITFRLLPVPDAVYTVTIAYQKKCTLFPSTPLSTTWAPIPDEYSYLYQQGFLAYSLIYLDNPLWQIELQRFLMALIGANQGISETEKNAFLSTFLATTAQAQAAQLRTVAGGHTRGA